MARRIHCNMQSFNFFLVVFDTICVEMTHQICSSDLLYFQQKKDSSGLMKTSKELIIDETS